MNRWGALAAILIVAAALALRLPQLSLRPLHNDEAVNAIKAAELWERGRYKYDPDEYHGPVLHYATLPFLSLSGAKDSKELPDSALRLAPVFFGIGLILLLPLSRGGLDGRELLWSGVFIAVSPAMVFYSRYFIHEIPLVFFTALAIGAGWRYTQTHKAPWAISAGASVGLMFATKETFVITLMAISCALIATWLWLSYSARFWSAAAVRRFSGAGDADGPRFDSPTIHLFTSAATRLNLRHLTFALIAFLLVWLVFFSSFFSNWPGLADSIRTYFPWLKRAGGHSPHIHPWYFYLERLAWFHPAKGPIFSEALILGLALIGGVSALWRKTSGLRCFLTFYTFALVCAYAIIPYKTPWCLLNFLHGIILLAGIGAVALTNHFKARGAKALVIFAIGAFTTQLAWQSWRANFIYFADRRNPYVYAQTLPDLVKTAEKIDAISRVAPESYKTIIKVITPDGDYWPLPWYLRRFERVGWFDTPPADPFAPIIIVSQKIEMALDERSEKKWIMIGYTELRPQRFLEVYVELELWKRFVATLPRVRDDE